MQKFKMVVSLSVSTDQLSSELLNMSGVNYELFPIIRMSAPKLWSKRPISEWPVEDEVFASAVLLFCFIPIDVHRFRFQSVSGMGFKESSKSLINLLWIHERLISEDHNGAKVLDIVHYRSKFRFLGSLTKPIYQAIFTYRHHRLKRKYTQSR